MTEGLRALLLALLLVCAPALVRAEASIAYSEVVLTDEGYVVNADITLSLGPRLIEAVNRGVALYFAAEFVVTRSRWYWLDERIVERRIEYRLSYQPITRAYRLSIGALHQNFDTLEEAVLTMTRIRNWQVATPSRLDNGVSYDASLRFRHDTTMLPKPFQITAIGNDDWRLSSDWSSWTFLAGAIR